MQRDRPHLISQLFTSLLTFDSKWFKFEDAVLIKIIKLSHPQMCIIVCRESNQIVFTFKSEFIYLFLNLNLTIIHSDRELNV